MPELGHSYTPAQAAALSGVAVKAVHNAIDKKIIARRASRLLNHDDLLRLKLWYGVGVALTTERRQRLFDEIERNPQCDRVRADDYVIIDVGRAREQISKQTKALAEAETLIHRVNGLAGGEPVFKSTRIPVRAIASMRQQGASVDEIVDGYPSLNARMVELAEIWSAANPARGRPKRLSELGLPVKSTVRMPIEFGDPSIDQGPDYEVPDR